MNDVQKVIYGTLIGFLGILVLWISFIYISACGFTLTCVQALPLVIRTPIPTLIPASHEEQQGNESAASEFNACQVSATDLIGAWVNAGSPESEPFPFTDVHGNPCEGTFADDVQHLFVENSLWYPGAMGCVSCHNAEFPERGAGLDLSSHQGILAGSNRSYEGAKGTDILGGGAWHTSTLHEILVTQGYVTAGHSPDVEPMSPVFVYAGERVEPSAEVTPTATP